jgi:DNA-directed RNA polymerase specialized sigma24 family protein
MARTRGRNRGRTAGGSSARDAALIAALLADDPQAWDRLVERHSPALRAVARLVFDRYHEPAADDDLDEVVREVFQRAAADRFEWFRSLRSPEMLSPSLRATAAWCTLGLLRAKYRVFTCALEAEAELGRRHVATAVLAAPPEGERAPLLAREDVDGLIADFMKKIGARPAKVLTAVYRKGWSYRRIAEREGLPPASVAQTLYEERVRLAAELVAAAPECGL